MKELTRSHLKKWLLLYNRKPPRKAVEKNMRLNDKPIQAVVYIIATLPNIDGSTYTNTGTGFVYENEFGRFITKKHINQYVGKDIVVILVVSSGLLQVAYINYVSSIDMLSIVIVYA